MHPGWFLWQVSGTSLASCVVSQAMYFSFSSGAEGPAQACPPPGPRGLSLPAAVGASQSCCWWQLLQVGPEQSWPAIPGGRGGLAATSPGSGLSHPERGSRARGAPCPRGGKAWRGPEPLLPGAGAGSGGLALAGACQCASLEGSRRRSDGKVVAKAGLPLPHSQDGCPPCSVSPVTTIVL